MANPKRRTLLRITDGHLEHSWVPTRMNLFSGSLMHP
jgi:hypothetical protein